MSGDNGQESRLDRQPGELADVIGGAGLDDGGVDEVDAASSSVDVSMIHDTNRDSASVERLHDASIKFLRQLRADGNGTEAITVDMCSSTRVNTDKHWLEKSAPDRFPYGVGGPGGAVDSNGRPIKRRRRLAQLDHVRLLMRRGVIDEPCMVHTIMHRLTHRARTTRTIVVANSSFAARTGEQWALLEPDQFRRSIEQRLLQQRLRQAPTPLIADGDENAAAASNSVYNTLQVSISILYLCTFNNNRTH